MNSERKRVVQPTIDRRELSILRRIHREEAQLDARLSAISSQ